MGMYSRLPTPNEPQRETTKWGSNDPDYDDFAALLGGDAKRCAVCGRVVMQRYQRLKDGKIVCPDHGTEIPAPDRRDSYNYGASSDSDFDAD